MEEVADCANVLTLIESFEDAENFYAVTRYMNGGSLFDYITKQPSQPLQEDTAQEIIRQIATGLKGLHEKDIVHRDIKIDNILVNSSNSGEIKFYVADLGSGAKLAFEDTASFMIGTRGYVAPEILKGDDYSKEVDIFSLGCLMHALLSAKLPFWTESKREQNLRVVKEAFNTESNAHIASLSAEAKNLLASMLAKEPSQRPSVE